MSPPDVPSVVVGRFALFDAIASGGMATVYYGRLLGQMGFSRVVAVKRMHGSCVADTEFCSMFLDEARIAWRIRHPNVVPIVEVVSTGGELLLVMEYVHGETLARLQKTGFGPRGRPSTKVATAIIAGLLEGLHAAHEARGEDGEPLAIVHRDVSPQNIMIGVDGVVRVLDFGVAKAAGRLQITSEGQMKGKIAYMSFEQLSGAKVDRTADIYSAGVVLWELLAGRKLFKADDQVALLRRVVVEPIHPPSRHNAEVPPALDRIIMVALSRQASDRFPTARAMAEALEHEVGVATHRAVSQWLEAGASETLRQRAARVAAIESLDMSGIMQSMQAAGQLPPMAAAILVPPGSGSGRGAGSSSASGRAVQSQPSGIEIAGVPIMGPGSRSQSVPGVGSDSMSGRAPVALEGKVLLPRRTLAAIVASLVLLVLAVPIAIVALSMRTPNPPATGSNSTLAPSVPSAASALDATTTLVENTASDAPVEGTAPAVSSAPSPRKPPPVRFTPQNYDPYGHQ